MSIWNRELSDKVLSSAKFFLDKPGLHDARGQHENQVLFPENIEREF